MNATKADNTADHILQLAVGVTYNQPPQHQARFPLFTLALAANTRVLADRIDLKGSRCREDSERKREA